MTRTVKAYGCAIIAKRLQPTETKGARIKLFFPEAAAAPLTVGWYTAVNAADLALGKDGAAMDADIYAAALGMYLDKLRADGFTGDDRWQGASTRDGYTFVPVRDEPATLYQIDFTGLFCAPLVTEYAIGTPEQVKAWAERYRAGYGAKHFTSMKLSAIPVEQWRGVHLGKIHWAGL